MPSQTPVFALPYPLGTDPVADGDDAIKALAERIEALHVASRQVATSAFFPVGTTSQVVTFPAGRFSAAPAVVATPTAGANVAMVTNVGGVTATGCTVYIYPLAGAWTSGAVSVFVYAVALTAG